MLEAFMVQDFAIQIPTWLAVVILIAVGVGLWKLATIVWAAISN
jgi:hypothetical protein